jgi:hypothetical protein
MGTAAPVARRAVAPATTTVASGPTTTTSTTRVAGYVIFRGTSQTSLSSVRSSSGRTTVSYQDSTVSGLTTYWYELGGRRFLIGRERSCSVDDHGPVPVSVRQD